MLPVNSVTPSTAVRSASSPTGPAVLGKDDFLRLLVTQLKYQDPMNPLDQNQFLAQTAQFTALEHMQNISAGIETLGTLLSGNSLADIAGMVGRTVRSASREVTYAGQPLMLPFSIDAPVSSVTVDIHDAAGALVRRLLAGASPPGTARVVWDGRTAAGLPMPAGTYTYTVSGTGGGQPAAVEGVVGSVGVVDGSPAYRVGDTVVRPWSIIEVR
jgi:flagellar basal-body rod modification protein FlgD